jgi:peptide/nickel transport system substrate-binding protein
MVKRARWVAIALVVALTAAACSSSSGKGAANPPAAATGGGSGGGGGGGTLIIGMTATNIPGLDTAMFQSEGGEGGRFVGVQLYDGLTRYDLTQGAHAPDIKPGLATSWDVTPDATTWTFHLRPNVKFTDGTPWNADAAVFNLDRMTNKSSPDYYPELNATAGLFLQGIASSKKIDDMTVEITTKGPYSYLLGDLALLPFGSPTAIKAEGKDGFAVHPVGTGPFKVESYVRGQKLVMVRNPDYWRGPAKLDRVILRPIPDATARAAAIQSGEVNWIEVPPPDTIPALKGAGFQVLTNSYSHVWPWVFDTTKKPFNDVRVRQALNYAIDRSTMAKSILNGTGRPALQYAPLGDAGYDPKLDTYAYDPAKAKQLLADAGYPNGFSFTLSFPTSGSGNMVPIPMNEALQKDLAAIGVKVQLQPVEWASMLTNFFKGSIPGGADAINISLGFVLVSLWSLWFGSSSTDNVGKYANPTVDSLLAQTKAEIDPTKRAALFTQINAELIKDAPWLLVVNDLNPRVLAPNVKGFVQPQSWYVDLTNVSVGK